ncbi:MAG: hypothetical protein ACXW31_08975, partial [Thermoanaerobaculia bacterium]
MRISSAGTITERRSACSGSALDAGSEAAGAAVVVAVSVPIGVTGSGSAAGGGATSATGDAGVSVFWGADTGGAVGAGSAGWGEATFAGSGEELEATFVGEAGLLDLAIVVVGLRGVLAARFAVDVEGARRVVVARGRDEADDGVEDT